MRRETSNMSDPAELNRRDVRRRFDRAAAGFDDADFVHRKTRDGLLADTRELAEAFRARLPDLRTDGKEWTVEWTALFLQRNGWTASPPEHKSWKNYVVEEFGGSGLTLEFPWHGRTTRRMRELGRQALCAWIPRSRRGRLPVMQPGQCLARIPVSR